MRSINISVPSTLKLRVTSRRRTPAFPQLAHVSLDTRDVEKGNDDELAGGADFDDRFGGIVVERCAGNDAFDFLRLPVSLALGDLAGEDDAFKVNLSQQ
jgi:hypothetical protein